MQFKNNLEKRKWYKKKNKKIGIAESTYLVFFDFQILVNTECLDRNILTKN